MTKIYIKDYWGEKDIVIGTGRDELIAIGEVIDKNAERYIHIKKQDLIDTLKKLGVIEK